jgi:hypothetical protein
MMPLARYLLYVGGALLALPLHPPEPKRSCRGPASKTVNLRRNDLRQLAVILFPSLFRLQVR